MIRSTSSEAYRQIKVEGLLSKMKWEAYNILFQHGPMTASELLKKARETYGQKSLRDNYQKRLGELRDVGVVSEVRTRACAVTGRNVIEWDVTDRLPVKLKRETRKSYACEEHHFFVISKDQKNCSAGHESLFPCKIRRVVFK